MREQEARGILNFEPWPPLYPIKIEMYYNRAVRTMHRPSARCKDLAKIKEARAVLEACAVLKPPRGHFW